MTRRPSKQNGPAGPRHDVPPLTPMQRLADLTRRIVGVPKSELPHPKKAKRK
jgi:hypothetical protein